MRTQSCPKRLVIASRLPNESRLAQSKRLGLSESTLRWIESNNRWPANRIVRDHYMAAVAGKAAS